MVGAPSPLSRPFHADERKLVEPGGATVRRSDRTMRAPGQPHRSSRTGKSHARIPGPAESKSEALRVDSRRGLDPWARLSDFVNGFLTQDTRSVPLCVGVFRCRPRIHFLLRKPPNRRKKGHNLWPAEWLLHPVGGREPRSFFVIPNIIAVLMTPFGAYQSSLFRRMATHTNSASRLIASRVLHPGLDPGRGLLSPEAACTVETNGNTVPAGNTSIVFTNQTMWLKTGKPEDENLVLTAKKGRVKIDSHSGHGEVFGAYEIGKLCCRRDLTQLRHERLMVRIWKRKRTWFGSVRLSGPGCCTKSFKTNTSGTGPGRSLSKRNHGGVMRSRRNLRAWRPSPIRDAKELVKNQFVGCE